MQLQLYTFFNVLHPNLHIIPHKLIHPPGILNSYLYNSAHNCTRLISFFYNSKYLYINKEHLINESLQKLYNYAFL